MTTTVLQIGNSDDKLTQKEWHDFVCDVAALVQANCLKIHFFGGPNNWMPWQNAAWIFSLSESTKYDFWAQLEDVRVKYQQDSIAIIEGETKFFGMAADV